MPELIAHAALALLAAAALRQKKSLVLIGSFLPDAKTFFTAIALPFTDLNSALAFSTPVHTIFGGLLLSAFIANFFKKDYGKVLVPLTLGVVLHVMLDATLYPVVDLNHFIFLYPFSWQAFGLPLYWLRDYVLAASLLVITYFIAKDLRARNERSHVAA